MLGLARMVGIKDSEHPDGPEACAVVVDGQPVVQGSYASGDPPALVNTGARVLWIVLADHILFADPTLTKADPPHYATFSSPSCPKVQSQQEPLLLLGR